MNKSTIFSKYLSDETIASIVSDEAFIKKMLQFETSLAKAQASLDVIPKESADEIDTEINKIEITPTELAEGTLNDGVPVVTLLSLIRKNLSQDIQKHLHLGATSQDVMDTAQILIIRDAVRIIAERIDTLIGLLTEIFNKYADVPCMAHTRGQQAIPITFGVKINAWLQPLRRQIERIQEIKKRLFTVQLGGAAGTLSAYGDKGRYWLMHWQKNWSCNHRRRGIRKEIIYLNSRIG
jgi:3-carboxy-cis,cis-muconate cycloisomerase